MLMEKPRAEVKTLRLKTQVSRLKTQVSRGSSLLIPEASMTSGVGIHNGVGRAAAFIRPVSRCPFGVSGVQYSVAGRERERKRKS